MTKLSIFSKPGNPPVIVLTNDHGQCHAIKSDMSDHGINIIDEYCTDLLATLKELKYSKRAEIDLSSFQVDQTFIIENVQADGWHPIATCRSLGEANTLIQAVYSEEVRLCERTVLISSKELDRNVLSVQ